MKPHQVVTDYLQGEKYPTLGSLSRKLSQLILYLSRPKPPQSWGLGKTWAQLPKAVSCMRDFVLADLNRRWDTGSCGSTSQKFRVADISTTVHHQTTTAGGDAGVPSDDDDDRLYDESIMSKPTKCAEDLRTVIF